MNQLKISHLEGVSVYSPYENEKHLRNWVTNLKSQLELTEIEFICHEIDNFHFQLLVQIGNRYLLLSSIRFNQYNYINRWQLEIMREITSEQINHYQQPESGEVVSVLNQILISDDDKLLLELKKEDENLIFYNTRFQEQLENYVLKETPSLVLDLTRELIFVGNLYNYDFLNITYYDKQKQCYIWDFEYNTEYELQYRINEPDKLFLSPISKDFELQIIDLKEYTLIQLACELFENSNAGYLLGVWPDEYYNDEE